MKRLAFMAGCLVILATGTEAGVITFDDLADRANSYGFDCDSDTINDVLFTTGPSGLGRVELGSQLYIHSPGLGGMPSPDEPDLRIDFAKGATGALSFGFALKSELPGGAASLYVYDASDVLLDATTVGAGFTEPAESSFPEGYVSLPFAGTASYALCDFTFDGDGFVIDNFMVSCDAGKIGGVPAPGGVMLGGVGVVLFGWLRWRRRL